MIDPRPDQNTSPADKKNAASSESAESGNMFDNRYELLSVLGAGGSGTAYKARDTFLDRAVVVKVLHQHLLSSKDALERFWKEAATTTGLSHNGIIQVYGHGVAQDGRPYMVMDCLEGNSLAAILQQCKRLELERFLNLFLQIADALSFAHRKGIVHRDLKPSNIIITREVTGERAVIVDFGIAKILDASGDASSTQTGSLLGSSAYMSPEQCKGSSIDARSDIYSLGCVMYEALSGRALFEGDSQMDVMYKHLNEPVDKRKLAELPAPIKEILAKCLEKDAAARYQTSAELRSDLRNCAEMTGEIMHRWPQLNRYGKNTVRIASMLAVALLCAGCLWYLWHLKTNQPIPTIQADETSAPRSSSLPRSSKALFDLLEKYRGKGKHAEIVNLLQSWLTKYMDCSIVPVEDKVSVIQALCNVLSGQGKRQEMIHWLDKLEKLDPNSIPNRCYVAANRAAIYRLQLDPARGAQTIARVLKDFPRDCSSELMLSGQIMCLQNQADCYIDLGNMQKAADLYAEATRLSEKLYGKLSPSVNRCRMGQIVALSRLKDKKAEIDSLISECLDSAADHEHYRRKRLEREYKIGLLSGDNKSSLPEEKQYANTEDLDAFYRPLYRLFLEKGDINGFMKYSGCLVNIYRKAGDNSRATELLDEQLSACSSHNDFPTAIEAAKLLLQEKTKSDIYSQMNLLTFIASAYTYQLHQPELARDYAERAYKLFVKVANSEPDFLIKQTSGVVAELLRTMEKDRDMPPEELIRRIDFFIDKCKGQDCTTSRHLQYVKFEYLVGQKKIDAAMSICNESITQFSKCKSEDTVFLFDWLLRKGQLLGEQAKLEDALQQYKAALAVSGTLPASCQRTKTEDMLARIADIQWGLGHNAEALQNYRQMEAKVGPDSRLSQLRIDEIAGPLIRYAMFCTSQGDYAKATALYARVMRAEIAKYGQDCPQLIDVFYGQAQLLSKQKRKAEAENLFKRVRTSCKTNGIDASRYPDAAQAAGISASPPAR